MANDIARGLLEHGAWPDYIPEPEHYIIIAEGGPDYLTWCCNFGDTGFVAVFGIVGGSWSPEIAARIPPGSNVAIRTHDDPTGEAFRDLIYPTLRDTCRVFDRRRGHSAPDDNEVLRTTGRLTDRAWGK